MGRTLFDIFFSNAVQSGLVAIGLPHGEVKKLMQAGAGGELTVDLEAQTIAGPSGSVLPFEFDPFSRHCLLHGLDPIARALRHEDAIAAYERAHPPTVATTALEGARA